MNFSDDKMRKTEKLLQELHGETRIGRMLERSRRQKLLIEVLRSELKEERFNNLRMRLDLQVLTERPDSRAAVRICHRWHIKKAIICDTAIAAKN